MLMSLSNILASFQLLCGYRHPDKDFWEETGLHANWNKWFKSKGFFFFQVPLKYSLMHQKTHFTCASHSLIHIQKHQTTPCWQMRWSITHHRKTLDNQPALASGLCLPSSLFIASVILASIQVGRETTMSISALLTQTQLPRTACGVT